MLKASSYKSGLTVKSLSLSLSRPYLKWDYNAGTFFSKVAIGDKGGNQV